MQKYPLSQMRQVLIEWKYQTKYSKELKAYEIHDKSGGELEIQVKNKITIINQGGSLDIKSDVAKFFTTVILFDSFEKDATLEDLRNFLADYDNSVYIRAQENEKDTSQKSIFFEK